MKIITYPDSAEVIRLANEYYDKWCDATGVKTPAKERVSKRFDNPVQHADTKAIALPVCREIEPVLTAADTAKVVTVEAKDEGKWTPVFTAAAIALPTKG